MEHGSRSQISPVDVSIELETLSQLYFMTTAGKDLLVDDSRSRKCTIGKFHCQIVFSSFLRVGVYERMKVDQRKFGKSSWTAAVERMERLRYSVAKETLQLQRAREICLDQRKHTLREEVWLLLTCTFMFASRLK